MASLTWKATVFYSTWEVIRQGQPWVGLSQPDLHPEEPTHTVGPWPRLEIWVIFKCKIKLYKTQQYILLLNKHIWQVKNKSNIRHKDFWFVCPLCNLDTWHDMTRSEIVQQFIYSFWFFNWRLFSSSYFLRRKKHNIFFFQKWYNYTNDTKKTHLNLWRYSQLLMRGFWMHNFN